MENIEERAAGMGWSPKEEFKGNPDNWVDAETYVNRSKNERNLQSEVQQLNGTIAELTRMVKTSDERSYKQAVEDIKKEQRKAAQEGDMEEFDKATKRMADLDKPQEEKDWNNDPYIHDWAVENPWFFEPKLGQYAQMVHVKLRREQPNMTLQENLQSVKDMVKKQFPGDFKKPNGVSAVEEGQPGPTHVTRKHTFDNLPQEAKTACERTWVRISRVKNNSFENKEDFQKHYAKTFEWDD